MIMVLINIHKHNNQITKRFAHLRENWLFSSLPELRSVSPRTSGPRRSISSMTLMLGSTMRSRQLRLPMAILSFSKILSLSIQKVLCFRVLEQVSNNKLTLGQGCIFYIKSIFFPYPPTRKLYFFLIFYGFTTLIIANYLERWVLWKCRCSILMLLII